MLSDLNKVEFNNVHEQASWVCQCDLANVQSLEAEFKATLMKQTSLGMKREILLHSIVYFEDCFFL
jgi:hypothetical protein